MKLVIVDDESALRADLVALCRESPDLQVVGEAASGAAAIDAARTLRPDLLLLDNTLPDMSGLDVLEVLRRRRLRRRTILLAGSALDTSAACAAGALDCLVKPIDPEIFWPSISRASEGVKAALPQAATPAPAMYGGNDPEYRGPMFLMGERQRCFYPLEPGKIDYIESAGNYVRYQVGKVAYIARDSIGRLEGVLRPLGFLRIERSLLLNIRAISYAEPVGHGTFAFTLASGARLHSGYRFRENILQTLPLRRRADGRVI
jgi:DNA-binding LytR/AlgR family response regulator